MNAKMTLSEYTCVVITSTQVQASGGDQKSDECFNLRFVRLRGGLGVVQEDTGECGSGAEARVAALTPAGTQRHRFTTQDHVFRDLRRRKKESLCFRAVSI